MKLWWPHCEALISYLMAYDHLRDPAMLERFTQVYDYTFKHVSVITINTPSELVFVFSSICSVFKAMLIGVLCLFSFLMKSTVSGSDI